MSRSVLFVYNRNFDLSISWSVLFVYSRNFGLSMSWSVLFVDNRNFGLSISQSVLFVYSRNFGLSMSRSVLFVENRNFCLFMYQSVSFVDNRNFGLSMSRSVLFVDNGNFGLSMSWSVLFVDNKNCFPVPPVLQDFFCFLNIHLHTVLVEYTTCTPPLVVSSMCACACRLIHMWSASLQCWCSAPHAQGDSPWMWPPLIVSFLCACAFRFSLTWFAWQQCWWNTPRAQSSSPEGMFLSCACYGSASAGLRYSSAGWVRPVHRVAHKGRSQLWLFYSCARSGAARRDLHHSGAGGVHHSHGAAHQRRGHLVAEGEAAGQWAQAPCTHLRAQVTVPPPLQAQHTHHHDWPRHRPCSFPWLHPGAGPPAPGR